MACMMNLKPGQSLADRMRQTEAALRRLEQALRNGTVKLVIAPNGAVAFAGWQDRDDITDVCAFRSLSATNSADLRSAVQRAEAQYGRKVNANAVAQGWHTHDGRNWSKH